MFEPLKSLRTATFTAPLDTDSSGKIRRAVCLVVNERTRQILECGFTPVQDADLVEEQLAMLASALLMPLRLRELDVAHSNGVGISVSTVDEFVALEYGDDIAHAQEGEGPEHLGTRIEDVVRGLAVGLAELERLLALKEAGHE